MRDANWIEGAWSGAASGDTFEAALHSAAGGPREWWPRSRPEDLVRAVAGFEERSTAWRAAGHEARLAALGQALDRWQEDTARLDELAAFLGFEEGGLDDQLEWALQAGDRRLECPARGPAEDERAALLRVPAGEFYSGLTRALEPLLAGRPVLLLADPDLPQLARDLVAQLASDERLAGSVALLHEDRSSCLATALASGVFGSAYVPGLQRGRLSPSSEALEALAALGGARRGVAFGAGVLLEHEPLAPAAVDDAPLESSALVVLEDDDPLAAAGEAYERAFGAQRALSGQAAGQVGRVLCHERRLSAFTEHLLERVEAGRSRPACRLFTSGLRRHCAELRRLGLDEGATLVEDGLEPRSGFRGASREAILAPSVFTNVEPTMGVARASRPAPVLALLRVQSDSEARALSGRT